RERDEAEARAIVRQADEERHRAQEQDLDRAVDAARAALNAEEMAARQRTVRHGLQQEPRWGRIGREQREREVEAHLRADLRRELAAAQRQVASP
ncbi:MAG: hypothetical protein ACLQUY_21980, partial [Ktedonobacterales bacterium]